MTPSAQQPQTSVTYYPATSGSEGSISNPSGLDVDTGLGVAFVANQNASGTLTILDVTTNAELAGSPVTIGPFPHGVAVDSVAHVAYVANTGKSNIGTPAGHKSKAGGVVQNTVSMVGQQQSSEADNPTWGLLATLTAGQQPHGVAVGRNMGGGAASYLFVANQADNSVSIFDCSKAPEAPVEIAGSPILLTSGPCANPNPHGIGADANLNQVYVACRNPGQPNGYVAVLNGSKNWAPTFIEVGNSPTGIGVNSGTGLAYASNNSDNTVSVIDGKALTVEATVTSSSFNGPDRFAVDEANNIVYVSNNTSNTVSAILAGESNSVQSAGVAGNPQQAVSAPTEMGIINGTLCIALQAADQVAEVPAPGAFG